MGKCASEIKKIKLFHRNDIDKIMLFLDLHIK